LEGKKSGKKILALKEKIFFYRQNILLKRGKKI